MEAKTNWDESSRDSHACPDIFYSRTTDVRPTKKILASAVTLMPSLVPICEQGLADFVVFAGDIMTR